MDSEKKIWDIYMYSSVLWIFVLLFKRILGVGSVILFVAESCMLCNLFFNSVIMNVIRSVVVSFVLLMCFVSVFCHIIWMCTSVTVCFALFMCFVSVLYYIFLMCRSAIMCFVLLLCSVSVLYSIFWMRCMPWVVPHPTSYLLGKHLSVYISDESWSRSSGHVEMQLHYLRVQTILRLHVAGYVWKLNFESVLKPRISHLPHVTQLQLKKMLFAHFQILSKISIEWRRENPLLVLPQF
jgi:hypothetical protein